MSQELDVKSLAAIDKVQKLLALAKDAGATQAEAESAMAMAQRLMEAYNIEMSQLGAKKPGERKDAKKSGGLYKYQRELWDAVARLNFCVYWSLKEWDPLKKNQYAAKKGVEQMGGWTFRHRILGSKMNVMATEMMAEYLEDAINRMIKERYHATAYFSTAANSFREGAVSNITMRLAAKREEILAAEREKARNAPRGDGTSLILASVIDQEKEANDDYLYGEGYSAKRRAERAAADAAYAARVEAERIRKANLTPEQAAAEAAATERLYASWREQDAKRAARASKRVGRREKAFKGDISAWYAGNDAARNVSLDKQVDEKRKERLT